MFSFLIACFCLSYAVVGQPTNSAVEYMQYFASRDQELAKNYLSYMSEVAHGNRARKMEKRRQELLSSIRQVLSDASRAKGFKGDVALRDAFKTYWDILYKVFNEDYHKIVDMEEIAEQSYDAMEAYLLAQEKASDVLREASQKIDPVYNQFAANNNVNIIDNGDTKMEKKLRQVGRTNAYYHTIFLIFFKSHKQEAYVWDAYNRKDINALEQNRTTLIKYADEGLAKIDTIKPLVGDGSLTNACRKVLEFHKREAEKQVPGLSDFLMKSDDFVASQKKFESKPQQKRTQSDIDAYNSAVSNYNAAITASNKTINDANSERDKILTHWNNTVKRFMESHIPKGK